MEPLGGTWLRKRTRQEAKKHGGAEPDEMGSFHYSFFRFFKDVLLKLLSKAGPPKDLEYQYADNIWLHFSFFPSDLGEVVAVVSSSRFGTVRPSR